MKRKAFVLVELLAVIVILAIILAIAVPAISNILFKSKRNTFESSVRTIIKTVDTKRSAENNYDITKINVDNLNSEMGIDNTNYESVEANLIAKEIYIKIIGKNKWEGLGAYGTKNNLTISSVVNDSFSTDESCFSFDEDTGAITGYDYEDPSCPSDVIIPSFIENKVVKSIGESAFAFSDLTSVMIPDTVTHIGEDAFYYNDLTTLELPNSIVSIGEGAFSSNLLQSIVIPSTITSISKNVFSYNQLTNVTIPSNINYIGEGAFEGNQLTGVDIPNTVTFIGGGAFTDNLFPEEDPFVYGRNPDGSIDFTNLVSYASTATEVVIPDGVKTIASGAFEYIPLSSVVIPNTVTTIGDYAFYYTEITNINLPSNVTLIGEYAFSDNYISEILIPGSVKVIKNCAFYNSGLSSVTILNGVEKIEESAFESNNIASLTLPNSINSLGNRVFNDNMLPDEQAFIYARNLDGSIDNKTIISYGGAKKSDVTIPSSVIIIGEDAFNYTNLTSVILSNSVKVIGKRAFSNNNLKSLTIPSSVTTIEESAFAWNRLTSITMMNLGTFLGENVLYYNNNNFREAYILGGAGKYTGTQSGTWSKQS